MERRCSEFTDSTLRQFMDRSNVIKTDIIVYNECVNI